MGEQGSIAVIGAGVVGATVAYALAREGRKVLLIDRADPGVAGASFGNVGHIAAELVQPLPSPGLLFGFYKQLIRFGGVLDLPVSEILREAGWMRRFAAAAFRRDANTHHLAPLVLPTSTTWSRWVEDIGQPQLLRRHGHYEVSFGAKAAKSMQSLAVAMSQLGIKTQKVPSEDLQPLCRAAGKTEAAALWFRDSAHVIDPLSAVRSFAAAALAKGATLKRLDVRSLALAGGKIEIRHAEGALTVEAAVVCAGMGSAALLKPFGLRAPLLGVRGYHIEIKGAKPFFDAPVVYADQHMVVTPMEGRLRASSYMEFAKPGAPPDEKKPAQLREWMRSLGYPEASDSDYWMGARPVLPDYLPGIGRAGSLPLYYCLGHQHIGLTLAPVTAEVMADVVAGRTPRYPATALGLERFGPP
jgi:D-amino-acid dehydrogenase